MGQAKRKWEDLQELKAEENLAAELGISLEELQETEYWLEYHDDKYGFMGQRVVYFPENAPEVILSKISGLTDGNYVELPLHDTYDEEDRYEAQLRYLLEQKKFFSAFVSQLDDVKKMNKVKMPEGLTKAYHRQLFAFCITALESFLSDVFVKSIESDIEIKKRFLKTNDAFKKKVELSKIYENYANIDGLIRNTINQVSFHNMKTARELFEEVLEIDFPVTDSLKEAVNIRHHIVHRNGRNYNGEIVLVDDKMVDKLTKEVDSFVETVAAQLPLE